jgi:hypothetical protein
VILASIAIFLALCILAYTTNTIVDIEQPAAGGAAPNVPDWYQQ